jgi:alkylation response protein AidB-like acyl-CoA dehydrogenase
VEDGRLTGTKTYVTNAGLADGFLVALADGGLAWVEAESEGIDIEGIDSADRTRRGARIHFDSVPAEVLERPAAGRVFDAALVLLAADALGGAWRMVEISTEYAKTRQQFGQIIGQFQAVKHQLADMAVSVEPIRALLWYAAHAWDEIPEESEQMSSIAKAHITDAFTQVARMATEILGGYGMTWECEVHIWLKRALFDRTLFGLPAVHRERVARSSGWSEDAGSGD